MRNVEKIMVGIIILMVFVITKRDYITTVLN